MLREFTHKVEVRDDDWPKPNSLGLLFQDYERAQEEGKGRQAPWPDIPVDHPVRAYIEACHKEEFNFTLLVANARFALHELGYSYEDAEAILAGRDLPVIG